MYLYNIRMSNIIKDVSLQKLIDIISWCQCTLKHIFTMKIRLDVTGTLYIITKPWSYESIEWWINCNWNLYDWKMWYWRRQDEKYRRMQNIIWVEID